MWISGDINLPDINWSNTSVSTLSMLSLIFNVSPQCSCYYNNSCSGPLYNWTHIYYKLYDTLDLLTFPFKVIISGPVLRFIGVMCLIVNMLLPSKNVQCKYLATHDCFELELSLVGIRSRQVLPIFAKLFQRISTGVNVE